MTDLTSSLTPVGTLVRLSVVADDRRADLGAPGSVPVAELIPGLARTLGLLDAATVYGGYRLLRADGRAVDSARSLVAQGVEDGAVLTLEAGATRAEPRVYDDVVEAVADAVEAHHAPWTAQDSARSAAGAAVALLLAAAALLVGADPASLLPPVLAAVGCVLVLVAGAVVGRVGADPGAGRVLVLTATVLGAVAGLTALDGPPTWGWPTAFAGAGLLASGAIGLLAMPDRRELCVGPMLVGLALAASGTVVAAMGADPGAVLAVVVAVVVACSIGVPWLALSSTPLRVVTARSDAEILLDPVEVDPAVVRQQYATGHRLQLTLRAAVGGLALVATPAVVGTGVAGTILLVLCYGGLLLSVRQTSSRTDVLLVVSVGVAGLAATALAAALVHPGWRGGLAGAAGLLAAVVVALGLVSPGRRLWLGRLADTGELLFLALLLPVALTAAGVV